MISRTKVVELKTAVNSNYKTNYHSLQFLRDYSGIPQLKNVQPEDIESVRLRYHIFAETELNSDSAMCVRLKDSPEIPGSQDKIPLYIVPLIDHKNKVDYNVSMQLCRKLNVSEKETAEYISRIEERNMGYLLENMEKMDIQAERKNTQDALRRAQEAEDRANKRISDSIHRTILSFRKLQFDRAAVSAEIARIFDLSPEASEAEVDKYWTQS